MDASPACFRPTRRQALCRGLLVGAAAAVAALPISVLLDEPPTWLRSLLVAGPLLACVVAGVLALRYGGTDADARGIRVDATHVQPWHRVVDLRAERRGARNVVSVYLDSGQSVQLAAPYSGGLFAADPQFELKVLNLAHLWRSHRFGGVPS